MCDTNLHTDINIAATLYLQHGGCNYYRQNDVNVWANDAPGLVLHIRAPYLALFRANNITVADW